MPNSLPASKCGRRLTEALRRRTIISLGGFWRVRTRTFRNACVPVALAPADRCASTSSATMAHRGAARALTPAAAEGFVASTASSRWTCRASSACAMRVRARLRYSGASTAARNRVAAPARPAPATLRCNFGRVRAPLVRPATVAPARCLMPYSRHVLCREPMCPLRTRHRQAQLAVQLHAAPIPRRPRDP